MTTIRYASSSCYNAEALDLSRPRPPSGEYYRDERSFSPDSYHATYAENRTSPSFYNHPEVKECSRSPPPAAARTSPSYASCYPGTEHLSQYVLQAAFQQQMMLQQKPPSTEETIPVAPKPQRHHHTDSDATSETGSTEGYATTASPPAAPPIYSMVTQTRDGKVTRPFKAYPKDPLSFTAGFSSVDTILDTQSAEKYTAFRKRMLEQICAANGGQATVSNPKMRRTVNTNMPSVNNNNNYSDDSSKFDSGASSKDTTYTERRKKNNAAAKKSRDRRRIKEDEIAIRAAFLERENIELKFELAAARKQLASCGITVPNC